MPHNPPPAKESVPEHFARLGTHYRKFGDDDLALHALAIADELARRGREPLRILTTSIPPHLAQHLQGAVA